MDDQPKRPKRVRIKKLMEKSTYMDFNQQKPDPKDPNEIEKTPLAPLPNSGEDAESPKEN